MRLVPHSLLRRLQPWSPRVSSNHNFARTSSIRDAPFRCTTIHLGELWGGRRCLFTRQSVARNNLGNGQLYATREERRGFGYGPLHKSTAMQGGHGIDRSSS